MISIILTEGWQNLVPWSCDYYLGQNNSGKWRDQLYQFCLLQTQIYVFFIFNLSSGYIQEKSKYNDKKGFSLGCVWDSNIRGSLKLQSMFADWWLDRYG